MTAQDPADAAQAKTDAAPNAGAGRHSDAAGQAAPNTGR